ncbi:hypothetical protein J4G08_04005 [Candidatus Poribacteria bacterium]|nr:hypothetical protein [Candidatus Poribacteria bacterium]
MKRFDFTAIDIFVVSVMLLLMTSLPSIAATFSGKVVDNEGKPVPGIVVTLQSFKGTSFPDQWRSDPEPAFPPPVPSETDNTGAFSITNITSPSVNKLVLFPEGHEPDYEVIGLEIEGIPFYVDLHIFDFDFGSFAFLIAPDADITDVKVTVRLRMRIRGQVLSPDGTPLRNVRVSYKVKSRYVGGGTGSESGSMKLDAEGHFVRYVDEAGHYTVSVTYQGQSATSKEILLEDTQRLDGLVLTLKGEQETPTEVLTPLKPPVPKQQAAPRRFDPERQRAAVQRRRAGVWIVNPETRHAYKRIYCETHEEAQEQATAEDAHLVAINSKAEQDWLRAVFRKQNFWIGLTDGEKEGERHWDNGEPVTYTNWNSPVQTSVGQDNDADKNYTMLIGFTGKWQAAREGSPIARMAKIAILEKEMLIVDNPKPKDEKR